MLKDEKNIAENQISPENIAISPEFSKYRRGDTISPEWQHCNRAYTQQRGLSPIRLHTHIERSCEILGYLGFFSLVLAFLLRPAGITG